MKKIIEIIGYTPAFVIVAMGFYELSKIKTPTVDPPWEKNNLMSR